jgi:hypothetical protein
VKQGLTVTIPSPTGGMSAPTGQVFSGTAAFNGDLFLATETGPSMAGAELSGRRRRRCSITRAPGLFYKGLTLSNVGGNSLPLRGLPQWGDYCTSEHGCAPIDR